jgi:Ca-activated chloride channel family protein
MRFAEPIWLIVGALASALVLWLTVRLSRQRKQVQSQLVAPALRDRLLASVSKPRRRLKEVLAVVGVAAIFVALARPQLGARWEEAHTQGVDLLFAVDVSRSMLARDVRPDRLERAKLAIRDLTARFPGDRVGLVAFAGDAFLQTPLTLDQQAFAESLDALDTHTITRGGTNVARALEVSRAALAGESSRQKLLVLLSDGEDLSGGAVDAAKAAARDGVKIFTVGVGTPGGELLRAPDEQGREGFVRDPASGTVVRSKLDETTLATLASATGGAYQPLGSDGHGLDRLYASHLSSLPRAAKTARMSRVPFERFQWALALAALALALEAVIGERTSRRRQVRPGRAAALAGALALLAIGRAHASPTSAETAYRAGKFQQATDEYGAAAKRTDDARLGYNAGAAAYRSGKLDEARAAFDKVSRTAQPGLQEKAYYNLGNTLYRQGQKAAKDVAATKARWQEAVTSYESALKLDAKDADAKFNLELVKAKLKELEEQQKKSQQSQDQQKQDQQKQDQQNQDQKNQQNQGGQGQQKPQSAQGSAGDKGNGPKPDDKKQQQQAQSPSRPGDQPAGSKGDERKADQAVRPGELTRQEAEGLLDSLRRDERTAASLQQGRVAEDDPPGKDW